MIHFNDLFEERVARANQLLSEYLMQMNMEKDTKELSEAMSYSVAAGGKRLRPVLIESFCRLFDGDVRMAEPFMIAMEMIHTYSLVHDDLPAIDNDDYRRGLPTTHKKYGEALAILSGDGLLHEAFYVATKPLYENNNELVITKLSEYTKALYLLALKSGRTGMLGGQTADVIHTGEQISDELMQYIYDYKTGALLAGSMMIGAALSGATREELAAIEHCGNLFGLAFQVQDDILDITGDASVLGKPILSDEKNDKKTYVSVHGLEQSKADVASYTEEAITILQSLNKNPEETCFLTELMRTMIKREN